MNIRVDPEFKDYLGALDEESRRTLEASIQAEGCRDALVVWSQPDHGAILLDGHNRHEICERLGIAYRTVDCPDSVLDRTDAAAWIVENQRGRRNITPERMAYVASKVYGALKAERGGDRKSEAQKSKVQNEPLIFRKDAASRVAEKFHMSRSTLKRNVKFADQVDAIAAKHGPEAKEDILERRKKISDYIPPEQIPQTSTEPEEKAVPETEPVNVSASDGKPPEKDLRDMDDTESLLWAVKNLPITMDCGAREGPVYFGEAVSDNFADPEVARRYDESAMKFICMLDSNIGLLPIAIKREKPNAERRALYKTRLSRHVDALQAIIETLGKEEAE